MSIQTNSKKPASLDWHKADIKAALEKAGWSLRRLSISHGYKSPTTIKNALSKPWPKCERFIADAIGVAPEVIWPSRYDKHGQPNRRMGKKPKDQCTPPKRVLNARSEDA